jgi:methionyl aminopeptidase
MKSRENQLVIENIRIKTDEEVELMRLSSRVLVSTLRLLESIIEPGVKTEDLDRAAEEFIRSHGSVPSFKGYRGFPASICTSVNSEVVHGIPGKRMLGEGDIVSIDVGVLKNGFHSDAAATFAVGGVSDDVKNLLETTRAALAAGVAEARGGNTIADISAAIQATVESEGFAVVRDLVGHGIGRYMHEPPQVPNFVSPGKTAGLKKGMALAIEPMVNAGDYPVEVLDDGWTVVAKDGSLSAHFEHTVVVREYGGEILTSEGLET